MGIIKLQNLPRLKLADLLKRRRMTLKQFMQEFVITTYEGLSIRCNRMGVSAPSEADFLSATAGETVVTNQAEGVVVLEPPPPVSHEPPVEVLSGDFDLGNDAFDKVVAVKIQHQGFEELEVTPEPPQKKSKKKRDDFTGGSNE